MSTFEINTYGKEGKHAGLGREKTSCYTVSTDATGNCTWNYESYRDWKLSQEGGGGKVANPL